MTRTTSPGLEDAVRRFAEVYWERNESTVFANRFLGIPTFQNPFDAWVTQEIIVEVRPDIVIETGTMAGGSALLWAMILDQVTSDGRVITIDGYNQVEEAQKIPLFQRSVDYLQGGSTEPAIVEEVRRRARGKRTVVILDSYHAKWHVAAEIQAYAPLVTPESYLIVQDSFLNGHPVEPGSGSGPYEAVTEFLARDDRFVIDHSRERMLFTFNPNGYLRRKS
jgi:cephalosporin hydroxylase